MTNISYADITNKVYVLIVHTSGNGFTLDQQYKLLHPEVMNAEKVVETLKQIATSGWSRVTIERERPGWMPTQPDQRPAWVGERPDSEFTAYWLKHQ